jgi:hypothetical protein
VTIPCICFGDFNFSDFLAFGGGVNGTIVIIGYPSLQVYFYERTK